MQQPHCQRKVIATSLLFHISRRKIHCHIRCSSGIVSTVFHGRSHTSLTLLHSTIGQPHHDIERIARLTKRGDIDFDEHTASIETIDGYGVNSGEHSLDLSEGNIQGKVGKLREKISEDCHYIDNCAAKVKEARRFNVRERAIGAQTPTSPHRQPHSHSSSVWYPFVEFR